MTDSTPLTESEARSIRPFLRMAAYLPEEFLALAEKWLFLVSAYGVSNTPSKPTNKKEWLDFYACCRDGWKQAQTKIAEFLISAVGRLGEA